MAVDAVGGPSAPRLPACGSGSKRLLLPGQSKVLSDMLASAAVGQDVCLIGARGEGKTFVARCFAAALGYDNNIETLFLANDMCARDLFTRRSTNSYGESTWQPTPLSIAMRTGRLCILDGLHRLPASSLSALAQLLQDRECQTHDGTRWISPARWDYLVRNKKVPPQQLRARGVARVHPAFRVVGLAIPREKRSARWISNEVLQMFHFFLLPRVGVSVDLTPFVQAAVPACPAPVVRSLVVLRQLLLAAAVDKGSPLWVGSDDSASAVPLSSQSDVVVDIGSTSAESAAAEMQPFQDHEDVYLKVPDPSSVPEQELPAGTQPVVLSFRAILRMARRAAAAPPGVNLSSDVGVAVEACLMTQVGGCWVGGR